jgi:hypothetical protein
LVGESSTNFCAHYVAKWAAAKLQSVYFFFDMSTQEGGGGFELVTSNL